jgi:antitoxin (DNA-binding transcriptional repressor) of toxin-antitoxin stability system
MVTIVLQSFWMMEARMVARVSKSKFKAKALELFRQVETSGEMIVITDHGEPTLEVRKYQTPRRDPLAVLKGSVLRYERPTDPIGEDDWEAAN